MNFKKYIGNKSFYKRVFALIIPIMLQQLLISIAGYVDNLMINSYGEGAIAYNGVSAANRMIFVLNFLWLGFATVSSIFISQFFGTRNKEKIHESFRLGLLISIIVGILSMVAIEFLGESVVNSYLQSTESRHIGYDYLNYIKYGCIITILNIFFANCLRSIEKPKIALIASSVGILVNIFLNYCMIFGNLGFEEQGAIGAANATNISRVVECLILIIFLFMTKSSHFRGAFGTLKISKLLVIDYAKKGIPLVLNEAFWSLGMVLLAKFYTYNNDMWYTAYGYSQNISDLFFIVFAGLGSSTAIVIGSALGRGDFEEAESNFYRLKGLAVIMGTFLGLLMILLSPVIVLLFDCDENIRSLTINLIRITGIFTGIYCYNSVCFFTMRAGGDNVRAFLLDEIPTYIISLPIAIVLGINAKDWGISIIFVYLASHISDIFKIFLSNYFIKQKKWLVNLTTKHTNN